MTSQFRSLTDARAFAFAFYFWYPPEGPTRP